MLDIALHTGTEHPDLLWILVPSLLTFITGLVLAAYSDQIRARSRPEDDPAAE